MRLWYEAGGVAGAASDRSWKGVFLTLKAIMVSISMFPLLLCRQENLERHSSAQSGNYHGALFIKWLHKLQQQSFMSVISHPVIWFAQKSMKAQRTHNFFLWCITIYNSYFKYFAWCNLCVIFILFLTRKERGGTDCILVVSLGEIVLLSGNRLCHESSSPAFDHRGCLSYRGEWGDGSKGDLRAGFIPAPV